MTLRTLGGLSTANYPFADLSNALNALTDAQRIALNTRVVAGRDPAGIDLGAHPALFERDPDGAAQAGLGDAGLVQAVERPRALQIERLVLLRDAETEVLAFSDIVFVSHNGNISCTPSFVSTAPTPPR